MYLCKDINIFKLMVMNLQRLWILSVLLFAACDNTLKNLDIAGRESVMTYVSEFNGTDEELYVNAFPNDSAAEFLNENIPVFDCPDQELEKTYFSAGGPTASI